MSVVVDELTVKYGDLTAVDRASFTAPTGAVTVVLGPNGAGKTSTVEVCEGFRPASAGSVSVLGLDPARDHRELTRRMGVMLQGGGVYPGSRVRDVVAHFCRLYDKGVDADALVERLGLAHRAGSTWRRLSGGEQQRVSLALALAADPEVVFLDEPTAGVDIEGRDVIATIIGELAGRGTTVVLTSHDMAEAQRVATHAVLFDKGRVIAAGALDELTSVRRTLRFGTRPGTDLARLASVLGTTIREVSPGSFEAAAPPSTDTVATVTRWLADNGLPLTGVDLGPESLEDLYRRLRGARP